MTKSKGIFRPRAWTLEERLLSGKALSPTGCWTWTGGRFTDGYGSLSYKRRTLRVHRVSASLYLGLDLNDSKALVCHKCSNKLCFNPEHLYVGNNSTNTLDTVKDWTHGSATKMHCPKGHAYTWENTYVSPDGRSGRSCRECARDRNRVKRKRLQEARRNRAII